MKIAEIKTNLEALGFLVTQISEKQIVVGIKSTISPGIIVEFDQEDVELRQVMEHVSNQLFLAGIVRGKQEVFKQLNTFLVIKNSQD